MPATLNGFYVDVKSRQTHFTQRAAPNVNIAYMANKRKARSVAAKKPAPTAMGARILDLMRANDITNKARFADQTLKISRQTFHAWLYKKMDADKIAAKPVLLCAAALGTNPRYLLGMTDDARVEHSLTMREAQLVQAFNVLSETDRDRLLRNATDWVGKSEQPPSASAPFRVIYPPATSTSKESK